MDPVDTVFAQRLRTKIDTLLNGDGQSYGLYYAVSRGAPSWDAYQRQIGLINGLEKAYELVTETLREMAPPENDGARPLN